MDTIFLVVSLFLPRTVLIVYYFLHQVPANNMPFIGDALLTVFLPRVLVLIYVADNLGTANPWFWIHLVVAVFVYLGFGKYSKRKMRRKGD